MPTFAAMRTPDGHFMGDAASALQKALRRGEEREALYWASEMEMAGYANYVWKRLRIIASEDVGLAEPDACLTIRVLYENWVEQNKNDKANGKFAARLFLVHAVIVLARARKSRMVDHAVMVTFYGQRKKLDVPDHALDRHTAAGKRKGRGWKHFFEVASHLENRAEMPDPYEKEARRVWRHDDDNPVNRARAATVRESLRGRGSTRSNGDARSSRRS